MKRIEYPIKGLDELIPDLPPALLVDQHHDHMFVSFALDLYLLLLLVLIVFAFAGLLFHALLYPL